MDAKIGPSSASPFRGSYILLFSGVGVLITIVVAVAVLTLSQLHDAAEGQALATTQSLAKSIELTIEGQISTIDVALLAASSEIGQQHATGKPDQETITQMLDQQIAHLRHAYILRATNEKGEVIYGSGVISAHPNNSDRVFFQAEDGIRDFAE